MNLPAAKTLGGIAAAAVSLEVDLWLLHQYGPRGDDGAAAPAPEALGGAARFGPAGNFPGAWGAQDHVPAIAGVLQWPSWAVELERCSVGAAPLFSSSAGRTQNA